MSAGLKIILDYVPDYSSDQLEWFQKSKQGIEPYSDYYVWHPGYYDNATGVRRVPNNWGTVFGGPAWTWVASRQKYYWHVFTPEQPELNWRSSKLVEEMKGVMNFWLDKGVAGFRVDSVSRLFEDAQLRNNSRTIDRTLNQPETYDMVTQFRALLDKFIMLETTGTLAQDVAYFGNKTQPGGHLPFLWEFVGAVHSGTNANTFNTAINSVMRSVPSGNWYIWFAGNHDRRRVATLAPGLEDAINMMLLLLPGSTITYMGEEIGMTDNTDITFAQGVDPQGCNAGASGYIAKTRDRSRTPLQWDGTTNAGFSTATKTWLPVNNNYKTLNIAAQESAVNSHLKVYKQAAKLRKTRTIQRGSLNTHVISNDIFAFSRELKGEHAYIVVVNTGSIEVAVNLSTAFTNLPTDAVVEIASVDSGFQTGTLSSHQGELGSIPGRVTGFSQVGIVPDDAIGRRVFSGISLPPSFRQRSIFTSITLIGLKTSLLRAPIWEVELGLTHCPLSVLPHPPLNYGRATVSWPGDSSASYPDGIVHSRLLPTLSEALLKSYFQGIPPPHTNEA
ncbi:hypothetical protein PR048_029326 [Dryococelus australis]|uniref:alpha-glucosidase n=1 Tax=Dryococelus australis TaxID=614101 RepID=A0ABQ9GD24_9NEOP|nr:hypothetical protein PR048_029326 [Dryococelus australis]